MLKEIRGRLELLLGIGLDYLNFNRRSGTLSGGESQRIRLSTQIGSGLMGMLYVLDEPSIGLHPKDNVKMIATLESLRDIGNTVIVVEHDEDTIRAADHIVEMGPGPGVHGGTVVVQGTLDDVLACKASPTGQFLSGKRSIADAGAAPQGQRQGAHGPRRAREQPQVDRRDVPARHSSSPSPARRVRARARWSTRSSTRRCGSGWSTRARCPASTTASTALEHVHKVVNIDQSPIGRNSRSNPATYIGFYDTIRDLFTQAPLSVERDYKPGDSASTSRAAAARSARAKARSRTQLYFMPDVEVTCGACKGARFNSETLEVTLRGKTIDDVLNMSVEEGVGVLCRASRRSARRSRCSPISGSAT